MTKRAGIDIGSTTVKLLLIDENNEIIYSSYKRHLAKTQETLRELLLDAREKTGADALRVKITGSGAMGLSRALGISFLQEVVAVATAVEVVAPKTDVAIELGGEDAKIIYFKGGLEERMNGVCAGGTGSFIDQMAALLKTDAEGLNEAAKSYKQIYSIAARCGVFAKTDIQPLINDGASPSDLAASIFQAVVNQTISGLACGKRIEGSVAFLGGPLHFMTELKRAFIRTLGLSESEVIDPENSHLFAALGAALDAGECAPLDTSALIEKLGSGIKLDYEIKRLSPLFKSKEEYEAFRERHKKAEVQKRELGTYSGNAFLGIDAGSTTTKIALIGEAGELLWSFYSSNNANPVETARGALLELYKIMPSGVNILRSCSTGYGEGLLKTAFSLDEGEVETMAHLKAAEFFDNKVDCVLDIGGQDMKCIRLKDKCVDTVILNEACSSGCGSFIENFASSMGFTAEAFSKEALFAENPIDLGTRCTVFMNSNVKQAQKEGAPISDISAGLAYSVIKNALYKVIKLSDARELGKHIVVQGGTFYNEAVLRSFEIIASCEVTCPDISGLMGAFGAALIARENYIGQKGSMLNSEKLAELSYTSKTRRCGGCTNNCMLTFNRFSSGKVHVSGNRCEKGSRGIDTRAAYPNLVKYKQKRMFDYEPLPENEAPRGVIGIPRVLNIYENFPFWATFFKALGFSVKLSPFSTRKIYELGMDTIPSESECYPAKLAHGHVEWLIREGVKTIFQPCVYYERRENEKTRSNYNCPIVISYAENIETNMDSIKKEGVRFIRPFLAFTSEKVAADRLVMLCKEEFGISEKETREAVRLAFEEQIKAKEDVRREGERALFEMQKSSRSGIVLAGRPYHVDPEINHGIPEMISSYGLYVFTEDSLPENTFDERKLRVLDQWVYHSRLYSAAEFVSTRDDLELVQLNSFGCGIDAVTCDQVNEILERANKLYTVLKIDEVNNLGAVRIRIRSLISAMNIRKKNKILAKPSPYVYTRAEFTAKMRDEGYTILAPEMSPIHFDILEPVFKKHGYNLKILKNTNREAIDTGLKYVNNDACYPSVTMVGQFMQAIQSGEYDTNRLALLMTQTGGCCRASNYVGFIRRALDKANLSHIPVISLNAGGIETNEGFSLSPGFILDAARSLIYGDLIMRCLYRTRPYEANRGAANALHDKWKKIAIASLVDKKSGYKYKKVCRGIVEDFDTLPLDESQNKARVGIVGEILVKYMPLANNHLVEVLEAEGAEVVVPDFVDFFNFYLFGARYKHKYLGGKKKAVIFSNLGLRAVKWLRNPAIKALKRSKRFDTPLGIAEIAEMTKPFLSLGNKYGEGWFLAGEMLELINHGAPNVVCIQPFACLPNHVVGKGVIKAIRTAYPEANVVAVDYDPGASEVNQLNRIKLMMTTAKKRLETKK